jgi:choline dehydrogenase-like flavoprotein
LPAAPTKPAYFASAQIQRPRWLDTNCKAHELDNLYVVDTRFFVSIGAVNPSLTAIANAIRVGDHLLQRLP